MRQTMLRALTTTLLCGGGLLALSIHANAQTAGQEQEPTELAPVLVTDGLTPVEQDKSGRAYTVLTGKQLEQNQIRYVSDALRQVPGFAVSRTGSYGGYTQVRVRGAESNQVLVMIDGVEANEASSGEFDFGSLLVEDIDRIEILRGPQSAFWGANASAGVVNIITKRGERNGWRTSARSEVGTDGTFLGGLALSGGGENYDLALSGAFRRSDGFNISDFGDEKDGDRNTTLNSRFNIDLSENLTVDGTLRFVDRKSELDPQDYSYIGWDPSPTYGMVLDGDDYTATREFYGSLGGTYVSLDGALTQKARFSGSDTHRDNYNQGVLSYDDGNRYNGTYQASYQFDTPGALDARHQITGGYEWQRETYAPSHLDETFERDTNSLVGEYRGEYLDQFFLNAAIRQDFNDAFKDATTYSISGAWKIPNTETRLHTSIGTGVTNPTFFEQFGYIPAVFVANPNLVPEKSFGWDIGVEHGFFDRMLVADVTYFNQNLTNEITTVYGGPPDYPSTPVNLDGESKRQGVEVAMTLNLFNGFSATATYTYTDSTQQQTAGGERVEEFRRPKHSGSISAAYTFYEDRARVFADATFNGKMLDNSFLGGLTTPVELDAYTVVNIGGSYKFNEQFEAFGRIENLFDEEYEEVFGYNTPGRTAFVGIRGTF